MIVRASSAAPARATAAVTAVTSSRHESQLNAARLFLFPFLFQFLFIFEGLYERSARRGFGWK